MPKIKDTLTNIASIVIVVCFLVFSWFVVTIFYPDEWFAEIPRMMLGIIW